MLEAIELSKSWPGFELRLGLAIKKGEIAAILGPSGCGKSTLLRLLAGLDSPDSGRVVIGGIDVTDMPPERRSVGMVFQDYALFPHLSVRRNIEYGPKMRGVPRAARRRSTQAIAASFEIDHLLERSPYSLSGGEQQRVALARALAAGPSVLLLDEPLSSLDASLRRRLRDEIGSRLRAAGMTALLVTHDSEEAYAVADRIFLMRSGSVEATGFPEELYRSPPTAWSASFLGRGPVLEILDLSGDGRSPLARTPIGDFACAARTDSARGRPNVSLFFPASAPSPVPPDSGGENQAKRNRIRGRVESVSFAGYCLRITLACPIVDGPSRGKELALELELPASQRPSVGEAVELEIAIDSCIVLPNAAT